MGEGGGMNGEELESQTDCAHKVSMCRAGLVSKDGWEEYK